MKGFLVDVNLPRKIDAWQIESFTFVVEINEEMNDSEIWNYARTNDLTILTKDSDFYDRIMISEPPPRVVHFRIGNMRLKELKRLLATNWETIRNISARSKLVSVYRDRIEVIE